MPPKLLQWPASGRRWLESGFLHVIGGVSFSLQWCSAVLDCDSCSCLCAGWRAGLTVLCMLVPTPFFHMPAWPSLMALTWCFTSGCSYRHPSSHSASLADKPQLMVQAQQRSAHAAVGPRLPFEKWCLSVPEAALQAARLHHPSDAVLVVRALPRPSARGSFSNGLQQCCGSAGPPCQGPTQTLRP
jgi:hypothetical protein